MRDFRHCLSQEVVNTLVVIQGQSSIAAQKHRRRATTLFIGVGARRRQIQSILAWLPNGDWTKEDVVEVYVPPGTECERMKLVKLVATGLLCALAGTQFVIFNRKRLAKNDEMVGQLWPHGSGEAAIAMFNTSKKH